MKPNRCSARSCFLFKLTLTITSSGETGNDQLLTWRWGSSGHWGRGSSSRWILRWGPSDAGSCCRHSNRPSALWSHHLHTQNHQNPTTRVSSMQTAMLLGLPAVKGRQPLGRARQVQPVPEASELLQERHDRPPDPHLDHRPRPPAEHERSPSKGEVID